MNAPKKQIEEPEQLFATNCQEKLYAGVSPQLIKGGQTMTDPTPHWHYRFDNYRRAFTLLREAMEQEQQPTQLEKEGIIQRFEYTMELAWKTLKDYLESENVVLDQITPRSVIRRSFEAGIIQQGETWQKALDARNRMSHTYNFETFERVIEDIRSQYLSALDELYEFLLTRRMGKL